MGLNPAMAIGVGTVVGFIGGSTAVGGLLYRSAVKQDAARVPEYEQRVTTASAAVNDARAAVEAARPNDTAVTTAKQAVMIAEQRFGTGLLMTATTDERDAATVSVANVINEAYPTPGAASNAAFAASGGRATAVGQVGDFYVPLVLDNALTPVEHTRRVSYIETEWTYHNGYNEQTGRYEYHWGPEQVTKFRDEPYLSRYDQFKAEEFGISEARTGGRNGTTMQNLGTRPEQMATSAATDLANAQQALEQGRRARTKERTAGTWLVGGGTAVALAGVALLGFGILKRVR